MISWDDLRVRVLSATFGALITNLAVTPLDVVKVRLQGQLKGDHQSHRSLLTASEAFFKILKSEGWLSLYRGFLPTMAMSLPGTVVYFVGYERVRDGLGEDLVKKELVPLLAGSTARIFASTVVSPLELIRTRMQFKGIEKGKLKPVLRELSTAVRSEGVFKVLWRGLQPTLWRDVPFSAIYWAILEPSKSFLIRKRRGDTESELLWWQNTLISFGCGAFSGAISAALTTPFDVAKTRQQLKEPSSPSSTWIQLKQIWKEEGWRGLTRGMVPRVAKVAPACAIMIGSYEFERAIHMKTLLYSDLELPRAAVLRIIKNSSDGKLVQKDAKLACTKAATVFISYLTAAAQDFATNSNQKTLSAAHIMQAVEAIGFGNEFSVQMNEALENLKKQALLAKESKAAANTATTAPTTEEASAQLLDIGEEEEEDENNTQLPEEDF